jgi:ABC-type Zn uptake system ZnuABC Zn-binding protein ZnuA
LAALTAISTFNTFVSRVAGKRAAVESLVPVGASPEDYQPTPADVTRLHNADILFENGVGLEVWLNRTITSAAKPKLSRVVLTSGLTPVDNNPHLWMDPEFARTYVRNVRDGLSAIDPAGKDEYTRNAAAYDGRLTALRDEIATRIRTIPEAQRVMITFHNAFTYYNTRFGLRTIGVIERSPGQEPSPSDLAALVKLARANKVRAIFSEPQFSPKLAQTLAQEAGVTVVELYSDTLGAGADLSTYDAMMLYDTDSIAKALGGQRGGAM